MRSAYSEPMNYQGLLCDLDGTLADSEPQHCSAWLAVLAEEYGIYHDEHWFEQYVGTSDYVLGADVIRDNRLDVESADLIAKKQQKFHAVMRKEGAVFSGVPDQLRRVVAAKIPLAIATNSGRSDTDVVVPALGLDEFTDVVVTATDVEHMKPAPDIYLLAAARLGLAADTCIAIEDSVPGGEAAKAAGCYLIGLNGSVDMADIVIEDNAEAIAHAFTMLVGEG